MKAAEMYMPDARVRPFRFEQSIDLPGVGVPKYGAGAYKCFSLSVPRNQVYIIKGMVFQLWERIQIGNAGDNTLQLMTNQQVAGQIAFEPLVNDASPFQMEVSKAKYFPLAGAQNSIKEMARGFTTVSEQADSDLMAQWWNPLFCFAVRGGQKLECLFRVLSVGTGATALAVSTNAAVTRRVDVAGAVFVGQIVSETHFAQMKDD